ncbi:hypothetical protein COLO4_37826 [Corchorus olitorius]|uniref:Myb-like domain-containing protein n=1 Tax=Corchorus olitorius TaxID=93759 RepID=A0A1R3FZ12_9ROSI|nr:hypothetical protein COLO4_37826 [Corchorus olitorius]
MVESSADIVSAAPPPPAGIIHHEGSSSEIGMAAATNSGEEDKGRIDEGERSFGGNRWPRQETLALLKIRSDMDATFRDSSLKGPLWEEVSRKLAELGYHRSAKKCKEKFENVYKYHKRTKDGRTSKADGKTYRFFDQLEALENLHSLQSLSPPKPQTPTPTSAAPTMPWANNPPSSAATNIHHVQSSNPTNNVPAQTTNAMPSSIINPTNTNISTQAVPLHSITPFSNIPSHNSFQNISSNLFSTSTSSSTASDDDSDHHYGNSNRKKRKWKEFFRRLTKEVIQKQEELQNKFLQTIERCEQERTAREDSWRIQEMARINREHEILVQERSTAATKDAAYQDNGPKAPLWEEISSAMRKIGYNRSAKRCKEKWENINKYFKKVKESNKKRPEDSKTCPYFHQLDAIYKERSSSTTKNDNNNSSLGSSSTTMQQQQVPLMARPEQQWPPHQADEMMEEAPERENVDEDQDIGDSEEEDYEGNDFELVANKTAPMGTAE